MLSTSTYDGTNMQAKNKMYETKVVDSIFWSPGKNIKFCVMLMLLSYKQKDIYNFDFFYNKEPEYTNESRIEVEEIM